MKAQEYVELRKPTCVFHNWVRDEEGKTVSDTVCGQPAVAVYISDDEEPKGCYVCQVHAKDAEINGDGSVFWDRKPVDKSVLVMVVEDNDGDEGCTQDVMQTYVNHGFKILEARFERPDGTMLDVIHLAEYVTKEEGKC